MTKCVLKSQLEISQIPLNLFGQSAQIGQLIGIFLKKGPHHMSIVHVREYPPQKCWEGQWGSDLNARVHYGFAIFSSKCQYLAFGFTEQFLTQISRYMFPTWRTERKSILLKYATFEGSFFMFSWANFFLFLFSFFFFIINFWLKISCRNIVNFILLH